MRKKSLFLFPLCILLLGFVWAFAAGDTADPLATLSYLRGVFTNTVDAKVDQRLDAAGLGTNFEENIPSPPVDSGVSAWTEARLKQDDLLQGSTGDSVLLLAGDGRVSYASGAVVDVSAGAVVPSGSALAVNHRYLVAEDTAANFTVTSKTAVVDYQGGCSFQYSNTIDYNAIASALKTLHLFQGSFTGYGQGFDLERTPTRLQALIMFIRVLGEEDDALSWSGSLPFADIQPGTQAERYVGYAFERGYTNGYNATQFRPSDPVNARQYTEFLLRAMGYSSAGNTNLSDTLFRAQEAGLLTLGEVSMLQTGTFLRAELVYVSYYALDVLLADSNRTLGESLLDKGVFYQQEWEDAAALVTRWRL